MEVPWDVDHAFLGKLPLTLTALELKGAPSSGEYVGDWVDIRNVPLLRCLTALQQLWMRNILIPADELYDLKGPLSSLHLDCVVREPEEEGLATMWALKGLTSLQRLTMAGDFTRAGGVPPWPMDTFTELTAASGLTALHIFDVRNQPLPQGAFQHVMPAGKQLPHLQVLELSYSHIPYDECACLKTLKCRNPPWCIDHKDVCRIAESCPGLRQLKLGQVLKASDGSSLACLPGSLRTLIVAGPAMGQAAAKAVKKLMQLQCLDWSDSPLTDAGLRQLTALTGLSRLRVARCPKLTVRVVPKWGEYSWRHFPPSKGFLESSEAVSDLVNCQCC